MAILGKIKNLFRKTSAEGRQTLAEKSEITSTTKSKSHHFIVQALDAVKLLEREGGTYICSKPNFECYFKKINMPLFEGNETYINIAFDKEDNVTHVCGLLPRLQYEKDFKSQDEEKMTLSKMPDCLLWQAISELSLVPKGIKSKAGSVKQSETSRTIRKNKPKFGKVPTTGQQASTELQEISLLFDPRISSASLKEDEIEWLNSMRASLIDSEYEILLQLLQHSIINQVFQKKIESFLKTKKELQPDRHSIVINSFTYLAREFQCSEQVISVAQIGTHLEKALNLNPKEIFGVLVELFFCLGYDKEIKGYTTGFY